ncbi:DNA-binding protein HU [bacterium HR11]|nr:DNA-binding protein HU [bacterium HR11]
MARRARGAKVTKAHLVDRVARLAGLTKTQAHQAIDAVIKAIQDALAGGSAVNLVGFGSFTVTQRKARKGRNPRTGRPMTIPARTVVRFRPGRKLREAVAK